MAMRNFRPATHPHPAAADERHQLDRQLVDVSNQWLATPTFATSFFVFATVAVAFVLAAVYLALS